MTSSPDAATSLPILFLKIPRCLLVVGGDADADDDADSAVSINHLYSRGKTAEGRPPEKKEQNEIEFTLAPNEWPSDAHAQSNEQMIIAPYRMDFGLGEGAGRGRRAGGRLHSQRKSIIVAPNEGFFGRTSLCVPSLDGAAAVIGSYPLDDRYKTEF